MKALKILFYTLISLLAIYIISGFTLVPYLLKKELIKNLDENLTLKSSIEDLKFNPITLNAKVHDFKLVDENNNIIVFFKELNISLSIFKSIEQKHFRIENITFDEIFLNIIQEKDGSINLAKILKPTENEEEQIEDNTDEQTSNNIKFLVSKIDLKNADINFVSNIDKQPFSIYLKDINYTIYDLGTFKNSLSSNNLTFRINEHTDVQISSAFKINPFKAYGKISINDLRIKEFIDFDKNFFNFELNNDANINLGLNYNIDTTNELALYLATDLLEINNINLKQNKKTIASLKKLDIKRFDFDLISQNINFNGVFIDGLKANMILDKNGVNFASLVTTSNSNEKKEENSNSKPWILNFSDIKANIDYDLEDKINNNSIEAKSILLDAQNLKIVNSLVELGKANVANKTFQFLDKSNNLEIKSNNINIDLNNLKVDDNVAFSNAVIKSKDLNFDEKNLKINVDTQNINLALNSFLFAKDNTISLESAKVSKPTIIFEDFTNNLKINAKNLDLTVNKFKNRAEVFDISSINLIEPNLVFENKSNNLKIDTKNINLKIKNISNKNNIFKVEKTDLNNPHISIILPKTEIKDLKNEEKTETIKVSQNDKNKDNKTKLNIGPVNIKNAILDFEDKNLPIPFKTTVTKLNGKISEIRNTKLGKTNLEVNGVVDNYGVAKITGIVNPKNIKILTDINMKFQNIAMQNFTPYTVKFVGRELKSGKLDLDLNYNIEKSNLNAQNNIVITKIELGKDVQSPEAISLPLGIAISLLEDTNGIIDINLPVSGNVDDPQFSIGAILWKAFVNLITKAVTAPFSLLGAMFNFSEDEIKSVKFEIKESEITPIQEETLDKIALILSKREDIAIKLVSSYNKEKESSKIGKERVLNIKEYLIKEKSINTKQVILDEKAEETSTSSINLKIEQLN
ncbi:DUF748 domain-containing protein [Aliarcobacter butzleri]|uniref:DUF748 domain-containing protein n=1 Tax=Aliarcobacter butzleri TaxID=28197 RepID=UPI0021B1F3EC|nr:DUF748 domain-containing protein [Aliarcobacter butzleri]MCT7582543.1 DUF748 domain-containing protein [Aliarcobacter butzleri]